MSMLEENGEVLTGTTRPVDLDALAADFADALSRRFDIVRTTADGVAATSSGFRAFVFRGNDRLTGGDIHPLLPFDRVSIDLSQSGGQLHIRYTLSTRVQTAIYGLGIPILVLFAYAGKRSVGDALMALGVGLIAWIASLLFFNPRGSRRVCDTARTALHLDQDNAASATA